MHALRTIFVGAALLGLVACDDADTATPTPEPAPPVDPVEPVDPDPPPPNPDVPLVVLELDGLDDGAVLSTRSVEAELSVQGAEARGLRISLGDALLLELSEPLAVGSSLPFELVASAGSNHLHVEAFNGAGQATELHRYFFVALPDLPTIDAISPADGSVIHASSVELSVALSAPAQPVTVVLEGPDGTQSAELASAEGTLAFASSLAMGANAFTLRLTDPEGQIVEQSFALHRELDATAPSFDAISPRPGHSWRARSLPLRGRVSDEVGVTGLWLARGAELTPITPEPDGAFSIDVTLDPAWNELELVATDAEGNERRAPLQYYFGQRIGAGGAHGAAIVGNQLYTWGRNNVGQLGLGYLSQLAWNDPGHASHDPATPHPNVPVMPVLPVEAGAPISVGINQISSSVLDEHGQIWSWGSNSSCQLGYTSAATSVPTPGLVAGLEDLTPVQLDRGYDHVLVLLDDGRVAAFGSNSRGQLGDGTTTNRCHAVIVELAEGQPLDQVVAVSASSASSFAIRADGTVWAWGRGQYGALGQGDELDSPRPRMVPGVTGAIAFDNGRDHTIVLTRSGAAYAWGLNTGGHINGGTDTKSPSALIDLPSSLVSVYANGNTSYVETLDGRLYGWGQSAANHGYVPSASNTSAPVEPVFGVADVVDAAIGALHGYAMRADGKVFAWGWSFEGSLGGGPGIIHQWTYHIPILVSLPSAP